MRGILKYVPLSVKLTFVAVSWFILYREREHLYRFCRYPFPFIMCPVCDYPCFFKVHRLQEIIGLGAVATGLVGGRVFCGAVCPVGSIQDWIHSVKRLGFSLFKRLFLSSKRSGPKPSPAKLRKVGQAFESGLRFLKYPFLLMVFLYSLVRFAMAFDFMPEWALIPAMRFTLQVRGVAGSGYINFWMLLLITVLGVGLIWHRPWCKFLCPIGLLFAVFNKVSFLRIKVEREGFTGCEECLKDCTLAEPLGKGKLEKGFVSVECVRCYDCVLASPEGTVKLKPDWLNKLSFLCSSILSILKRK